MVSTFDIPRRVEIHTPRDTREVDYMVVNLLYSIWHASMEVGNGVFAFSSAKTILANLRCTSLVFQVTQTRFLSQPGIAVMEKPRRHMPLFDHRYQFCFILVATEQRHPIAPPFLRLVMVIQESLAIHAEMSSLRRGLHEGGIEYVNRIVLDFKLIALCI